MLIDNYEITRRLCSLPECQNTSYLVLTHVKKSTCGFLAIYLEIAAAVNMLNKKPWVKSQLRALPQGDGKQNMKKMHNFARKSNSEIEITRRGIIKTIALSRL